MTDHLHNCIVALAGLLPDLSEEQIVPGLKIWTCGTQACFGGWIAQVPFFQAQGVQSTGAYGSPGMADGSLAEVTLFGDDDLFNTRGAHFADSGAHPSASDLDIIRYRLEQRILDLTL